ncbi:hypothetical protein HKBW3S25_00582 [Candidatus Hakubella thermalkaliphila]|uniref:Transposase IS204/IS1001/IS1096/IS1165 zinc-finger domain-containing protein n=2 Tax=Candidatus Hakubella thermalkaliphila TaxID=2754717 RepID=A0A6V8NY16_9ACTN|nr:hypothetical protein HKBW3S25_00582 [Candidatus Hakubella thermalkaliphila]
MGKVSKKELPLPFGLRGIRVMGITEFHGSLAIRVEKDIDFGICPHCGVLSQQVNDRHVHEVIDRPVFEPGMSLQIVKRRWKCINDFCCAVTFTEEVGGLPRGCKHTVLFQKYLYQLSRHMTLSGVKRHLAEAYRCPVSVASVYRVAQNHLTEKINLPTNVETEYIGLDEFSKGKGHDYAVVLVDLVERKVIDVAPGGKTKKAAREVLAKINPQGVRPVPLICGNHSTTLAGR